MDERPPMYYRYVDDIFVDVQSEEHLNVLRGKLKENSSLNFSIETSVDEKLPFLDLLVHYGSGDFVTDVYRKPTDLGRCMNGNGDCSDSYKLGVIRAYVRRAIRNCSNWALVHRELKRVRQMLVNNGYSNSDFDKTVKSVMDRYVSEETATDVKNDITVYYRNTMTSSWKRDEKAVRDIVHRNCKTTDPTQTLKLIVYYKNPKTASLVMQNNASQKTTTLKRTNVVYNFQCTTGDCATREVHYIGHTTTSLSRRLTMHLQDGAPKKHFQDHHNTRLTRNILVTNTTILAHCHDRRRLATLETVYIRNTRPTINIQSKVLTQLPLFDKALPPG